MFVRLPLQWRPLQRKDGVPLPDKPSIAVLPFVNLSKDPDQEYFIDGMTDDLVTDLSKISGVFVIARTSSFAYKGKNVKVKQVAEELGVGTSWRVVSVGMVTQSASMPSSLMR